MRGLLSFGLAAAVMAPQALTPSTDEAARFLALGIRQVSDGEFEEAVFTLDTAVRRLAEQPGRGADLARAYVFLGAAYVRLNHEDAAKGKFREALKLEPELRLSLEEFPPRVIQVFDTQLLKRTAERKSRGAKLALLLGGIGAAGIVGVAAATESAQPIPNRPPTGVIGFEGQAIVGVTLLRFTAAATDPDGDPISYRWDFGDGGTATGQAVTHRFDREGTFGVTVTLDDGRGASGTAVEEAVARSLTGTWRVLEVGRGSDTACVQAAPQLDCGGGGPVASLRGTLSDPYRLDGRLLHYSNDVAFSGDVRSDLEQMTLRLGRFGVITLSRR